MDAELKAKYEALADVLSNIANIAVTEQELNTTNSYKITLGDKTIYTINIWKDKTKYKISVNGYSEKIENIVKRSDTEYIGIIITIFNMLKQLATIEMSNEKKNN